MSEPQSNVESHPYYAVSASTRTDMERAVAQFKQVVANGISGREYYKAVDELANSFAKGATEANALLVLPDNATIYRVAWGRSFQLNQLLEEMFVTNNQDKPVPKGQLQACADLLWLIAMDLDKAMELESDELEPEFIAMMQAKIKQLLARAIDE